MNRFQLAVVSPKSSALKMTTNPFGEFNVTLSEQELIEAEKQNTRMLSKYFCIDIECFSIWCRAI